MDITGKLVQLMPEETGEGKNGTWKKRQFVIETLDNYPKKVCMVIWGDRVDMNSFRENEVIRVYFDVESREWNGRWYTDLRAWKIEKGDQNSVSGNNESSQTDYNTPSSDTVYSGNDSTPSFDDDLPF